jgi:hypothetical protein
MTNLDREHFDIECVNCTTDMLASAVDITTPSPKLEPTGLLATLPPDIGEHRSDFECLNCTVESLLKYLQDEHGFTVTPKEETVRYVWVKAETEHQKN